jgi:2-polyprenyl-3-methyl-5-hydroxy-6-metoxy-1,4-benzoquinol methylase
MTAERISSEQSADKPIYLRHVFAYNEAAKLVFGDILELGCGEGYGYDILAPHCKSYTAVDKFKETIAANTAKNRPNAVFKQHTLPSLSLFDDQSFDCVVSFQVIEHIKNDTMFIQEAFRVLKPNGLLILTTPNIEMSLTRNPWHVREYTVLEFEKKLKQVSNQIEMKGVYGKEPVKRYYERNKIAVERITRFDIFKFQRWMPAVLLQIPYDILNRFNRNNLNAENTQLLDEIKLDDYYLDNASSSSYDHFCVVKKGDQ